jgi:hypothetical protein
MLDERASDLLDLRRHGGAEGCGSKRKNEAAKAAAAARKAGTQ